MIPGVLNVINVVRHYLLGDGKDFPRHQHARHATTFSAIRWRIWFLLVHITTRWLGLFTFEPQLYEYNYVQGKQYQVVLSRIAVRVRVWYNVRRLVASARRSGQEDFQRETPPVSLPSCWISPFLIACIITKWSTKDHETDSTGASILTPLLLLNFNVRLYVNRTAWFLFFWYGSKHHSLSENWGELPVRTVIIDRVFVLILRSFFRFSSLTKKWKKKNATCNRSTFHPTKNSWSRKYYVCCSLF